MRRLVLVGGGLAHLEVLRRHADAPFTGTEVIVISDAPRSVYAGMLPGVVAGHYRVDQMTVDLVGLAEAAGVTFRRGRMCGLDLARSEVVLDDATRLGFSHLSLNTGASARSVASEETRRTLPIKPAPDFVAALDDWEGQSDANDRVGVVGGGAAGIEMVLALAHRWQDQRAAPVLIERSGENLDRIPAAARGLVRKHLRRAGVSIHRPDETPTLALAINAAGAAPPDWLADTGLQRNGLGYLAIRPTLQVTGHDQIFAAGDAASIADHPRAKAGVFAVRQGPVLYRNIARVLDGEDPVAHRPQSDWLSLIATGSKHAIATRNGVAAEGRWAWYLKDLNDRRYIARYRALAGKAQR
jgi:pyridine nucleotide-disulfide oxidoreductase family protein